MITLPFLAADGLPTSRRTGLRNQIATTNDGGRIWEFPGGIRPGRGTKARTRRRSQGLGCGASGPDSRNDDPHRGSSAAIGHAQAADPFAPVLIVVASSLSCGSSSAGIVGARRGSATSSSARGTSSRRTWRRWPRKSPAKALPSHAGRGAPPSAPVLLVPVRVVRRLPDRPQGTCCAPRRAVAGRPVPAGLFGGLGIPGAGAGGAARGGRGAPVGARVRGRGQGARSRRAGPGRSRDARRRDPLVPASGTRARRRGPRHSRREASQ